MNILVVDDKQKHLDSAKETLVEMGELTCVDNYDKVISILIPGCEFDVVLSDLMMPMSHDTLVDRAFDPSAQVPYGFVLALRAASVGVKYCAVVTDTNHHQGAMSAALDKLGIGNGSNSIEGWNCYWDDTLRPNFVVNKTKAFFVHTPFVNDNPEKGKDWGRVLKALISTEKKKK